MHIVCENYNLSHFAGVLLHVGNQFTRSYFPNTDFSFVSSGYNKLMVVAKTDASDSIFMSIVNLPKLLVVVDSKSSYFAICPSRKDDLISEDRAKWINSRDIGLLVNTSGFNLVVIGIPKTNGPISRTSNKLVRHPLHVTDIDDCLSVVFSQKHI